MTTHHKSPIQLLSSLVVSSVNIHTVQPGVHAGVSEAFDTQHGLLCCTEHREGFIVKLTLWKY